MMRSTSGEGAADRHDLSSSATSPDPSMAVTYPCSTVIAMGSRAKTELDPDPAIDRHPERAAGHARFPVANGAVTDAYSGAEISPAWVGADPIIDALCNIPTRKSVPSDDRIDISLAEAIRGVAAVA